MTVVLDAAPEPEGSAELPVVPDIPSAPPAAGFPSVDLRLVQLVVESAAKVPADCPDDEVGGAAADAVLLEQIGLCQAIQHTLAALQATLTRRFARRHVATRLAAGETDPAKLERSVVGQVALACRVSPTQARQRVRTARDLHDGLDHVRGLHAAGELSSRAVDAVVRATRDLDTSERTEVDRRLATHDLRLLGVGRIGDLARRLAAEVAPETFRARVTSARADRRVTLRPGEDGMAWLTAHLPVEQGAACYAALDRAHRVLSASPEPLTRGRGQVMADTLVERLTGQATADAVPVEIQALVPVEALLDPDSPLPADIPGLGPVPADLLTESPGRRFLRRLVTRTGIVIGGESRRRCFSGALADLIRARSRHRCSEPYCDAPVRHLDHIHRADDGGPTSMENGRGVCEFHNHLREQPGWQVHRTERGVETTTPTGHTHLAPPG